MTTAASSSFVNIVERTNVTGSAKFRKLITNRDYAAALVVARDQALADQVLLQLLRFVAESLRDSGDAVARQRREPAEQDLAFFEIALPQAVILDRQQQARLAADSQST